MNFHVVSSQAGFAAKGAETTTQFPEINLQEKVSETLSLEKDGFCENVLETSDKCPLVFQDWTDYDEKASESVGIYEVTHQFIKC